MNKSEFWFDLPNELIAQTPIDKREQSRLLCLSKTTGSIQHKRFFDLPELLRKGDCLVMNDSRVLPARLLGKRETGGNVELLLLRNLGGATWECMARPGRRMRAGAKLLFGDSELTATITEEMDGGNRLVIFDYEGDFIEILERIGKMPLPPYIRDEPEDAERYQTVYSRPYGSAAAPTAGLHFTEALLNKLEALGINLCYITLHVGQGTFLPVRTDEVEEHKMHSEYFTISEETAERINDARTGGGRIVAVGTTSCRALESCAYESPGPSSNDSSLIAGAKHSKNYVKPYSGYTDIFIYPGHEFRIVDCLITNFHLPESTLIMLVSALAGRENVKKAYEEAIRERYRFYSFGDAMFIA